MGWPLRARTTQIEEASSLIIQAVSVTAIVVTHNGDRFLPRTLSDLGKQTRLPDHVIGVDAGSTDDSLQELRSGLPEGSPVISGDARGGFGAQVRAALEHSSSPRDSDTSQQWLWLLHDDSAPAPDALQLLLEAVERAPSVTIAGAKLLEGDDPEKLQEVGLSISRWAERQTLIGTDELDQGQYDQRSDTFAVNSAGMLVRRDVFEHLGGFDPALHGTGDDIDLSWRNRLAGHRVVVVPAARMVHQGKRGNQNAQLGASRSAEVFLRLKFAPLWKVPFLAVGAVLGGLWRFLAGMLAKNPSYGFSQLFASIAGVCKPFALMRSRSSVKKTRTLPRSVVSDLIVPRAEVRAHRKALVDVASENVYGDGTGSDSGEYVPSGDSADDFESLATPNRLWSGFGAILAVIVLGALGLVGMSSLIGAEALTGGAMLPVSEKLTEIWANASTWWIGLGSGVAAHADPFGYVLFVLGILGFGDANAAVVALTLLSLPLAGLSMWFASAAFTARRGLRLWAAFLWGSAPALFAALGNGRLGALITHIVLPLLLLAIVRSVGAATLKIRGSARQPGERITVAGTGGVRSWTAAAAAGLLLAVVTASAPALSLVLILAVLILIVTLRRRAVTLWWTLGLPLTLIAGQAVFGILRWQALLGDLGFPLYSQAAPAWQQVLGFPAQFDATDSLAALGFTASIPAPWALIAAICIGGPLVVVAIASLFLGGPKRVIVRYLWVLAVLALVSSVLSQTVVTAVAPNALVSPFTGPFVSLLVLSLAAAALIGADRLLTRPAPRGEISRPDARPRVRAVGGIAVVLLAISPLVSAGLWLLPQLTGAQAGQDSTLLAGEKQVRSSSPELIPATAADRALSGERTATLVLTPDDSDRIQASLMRGAGTSLDQMSTAYVAKDLRGSAFAPELAEDDGATAVLKRTVASIVAGQGTDPRADLRELGVAFVVLADRGTASQVMAPQIDSVVGLSSVGKTDTGWLWRVGGAISEGGEESTEYATGFARIADQGGKTLAVVDAGPLSVNTSIDAGPAGRELVLSERSDRGWVATLDGQRLEPSGGDGQDSWAQRFALPESGGLLKVEYRSPFSPWLEIAQVLVLALTVLLAIPLPTGARTGRASPVTQRADSAPQRAGATGTGRKRKPDQENAATPAAPADAADEDTDETLPRKKDNDEAQVSS